MIWCENATGAQPTQTRTCTLDCPIPASLPEVGHPLKIQTLQYRMYIWYIHIWYIYIYLQLYTYIYIYMHIHIERHVFFNRFMCWCICVVVYLFSRHLCTYLGVYLLLIKFRYLPFSIAIWLFMKVNDEWLKDRLSKPAFLCAISLPSYFFSERFPLQTTSSLSYFFLPRSNSSLSYFFFEPCELRLLACS